MEMNGLLMASLQILGTSPAICRLSGRRFALQWRATVTQSSSSSLTNFDGAKELIKAGSAKLNWFCTAKDLAEKFAPLFHSSIHSVP